ncbi:hypothetical protein PV10_01283 [Exophiala mesophila]|uniref:SEC63 domain-containing protein n=1 Tax=Exophiala mesophila TaxID=212818 RepID=A0A0D1ZUF1_EXOME|nr:uncharacterized protein PV10_01283 [Exophiala mesophila]KIV97544.1 hypothetical protein PV10_01283 [Exophiala mesophila]
MRCIIDCQILRRDSVSTRNALELGRSLAAHVWDNNASQLRQLDGLGEVSVRKLASRSINSIDALLNTEPSRIETILGKNPPFGLQLLKQLESFPNLRVSIKETGRELKRGKAIIRCAVEIGFLNEKIPHFHKKRPVFVCCLTETADDQLVDFRKFKAERLQEQERIPLTVELIKPTTHIKCFVMCDEVAGTSKSAELTISKIPLWVFRHKGDIVPGIAGRDSGPPSRNQRIAGWSDDFDNGGVDDNDLLALEGMQGSGEVVEDIDEILDRQLLPKNNSILPELSIPDHDTGSAAPRKPQLLQNGCWTCQHDCLGKGRRCKHKCCSEGVAKPKQRPRPETDSNGRHQERSQSKPSQPSVANAGGKPPQPVDRPTKQHFPAFKPHKRPGGGGCDESTGNQSSPKRFKLTKGSTQNLGSLRRRSPTVLSDHDGQRGLGHNNHDGQCPEDLECEEECQHTESVGCHCPNRCSSSTEVEGTSGYNSTIPTAPDAVDQDAGVDKIPVQVIGEPEIASLDRWTGKNAACMASFSPEPKNFGNIAPVIFKGAESGIGKELGVDAFKAIGMTSEQDGGGSTNVEVNQEEVSEVRATSYEENQRLKWKGIDKWLYDEVSAYVELI